MLPTADVVNSVIFAGGVVEALAEGAVWAQMGTIGLAATTAIGSQLGQLRARCHVRGRPGVGQQGTGRTGPAADPGVGQAAAADRVGPVFGVLGRKTVWLMARPGSVVKLVVNAYMSILIEGVAETMELADRLGIASPAARRGHRGRPAGRADRRRQAAQDGRR